MTGRVLSEICGVTVRRPKQPQPISPVAVGTSDALDGLADDRVSRPKDDFFVESSVT